MESPTLGGRASPTSSSVRRRSLIVGKRLPSIHGAWEGTSTAWDVAAPPHRPQSRQRTSAQAWTEPPEQPQRVSQGHYRAGGGTPLTVTRRNTLHRRSRATTESCSSRAGSKSSPRNSVIGERERLTSTIPSYLTGGESEEVVKPEPPRPQSVASVYGVDDSKSSPRARAWRAGMASRASRSRAATPTETIAAWCSPRQTDIIFTESPKAWQDETRMAPASVLEDEDEDVAALSPPTFTPNIFAPASAGNKSKLPSWQLAGQEDDDEIASPLDPSRDFELCLQLARKHGAKVEDVRAKLAVFRQFDLDSDCTLSVQELENAVAKLWKLPKGGRVPHHLMKLLELWLKDDAHVNFETFFLWTTQCEYSEEASGIDPYDRQLRQLARRWNVCVLDLEKVYRAFQRVDAAGTGKLNETQFGALLQELRYIDSVDELTPKVRRWWKELSRMGTRDVCVHDFVGWFFAFSAD